MNDRSKSLIVFLIGLAAAFLVLEIGLRALGLVQLTDEYSVKDEYLKFKLKPDVTAMVLSADRLPFEVKTVSLGFDGIGFRDDGIDGEPYAVVLGDSFTFGVGVEDDETWVRLLESKYGRDFVNMGVYGYSTISQERMLEQYGIKLNPKLAIVGFSINDYSDSYNFFSNVSTAKNLFDDLKESVAVMKFIWQTSGELKHDLEIIKYNDGNLDFVFWPQPAIDDVDPKYEKVRVGEQLAKESLLRIRKITDEVNATLLIVILPAKEQIYWNIVGNLVKNPEDYKFDYPVETMNQFCDLHTLKCLDLTPVFMEKAMSGEQLFFRIDSHYNELGNELVASEVYEYLASMPS